MVTQSHNILVIMLITSTKPYKDAREIVEWDVTLLIYRNASLGWDIHVHSTAPSLTEKIASDVLDVETKLQLT